MVFVYRYDTPNNMKDNQELLKEFMNKLYIGNVAIDRVQEVLNANDKAGDDAQNEDVADASYKGICCNPIYSRSTFVGCALAIFQ
jgi:hypothetical protein